MIRKVTIAIGKLDDEIGDMIKQMDNKNVVKVLCHLPVCVWSLILATSTGHATTSCAAPPAQPAQNISQLVGFNEVEVIWPPRLASGVRSEVINLKDTPYTPKKREFKAPAAKIG